MNVNENALIQVQDLKKSFGTQVVLDGITTEIDQGEVVAIIGPSGCGKSTFLRSLNLLEEPTSGTILFEGTDITDKSVDIRKSVWYFSSSICSQTIPYRTTLRLHR